ncbi:hypothetical protein [Liquorilactobacillus capillatus]|uniref:Uncharacterized protein n=1 Tax=Liquorilactobacillus capillatus DSM 19910 TaxID=1423731 RepID=A0A0R1M094_9LACO|nr:hypothetical protein [Liquorilactobacillus capillatus]KRL01335.1 hypothetical protein FC81_GL001478 [Liquorilactobacillus capillatus DSM 19910]
MLKICEQKIAAQKLVSPHLCSHLASMWQHLPLPPEYKNGNNLLLTENFDLIFSPPFIIDQTILYLVKKHRTSKGKAIIELILELDHGKKMMARVGITLMTESEWDEKVFKYYTGDGQ